MSQPDVEIFTVEDFRLECGVVLPQARLAWFQQGVIGKESPILTCTAFSRDRSDLAYLAASGAALDPARHWLIHTEQLGNGRSTSPSNTQAPFDGPDFPALSIRDNVALQSALLDYLGVLRLKAVVGGSMGGQQAIQWAVSQPERIGSVVSIVGNARTTLYAQIFLNAVSRALTQDPSFREGRYILPPLEGLSRMAETWAGFLLSPRFFSERRHMLYADAAGETLDAFLALWRPRFHSKDANDLLSQVGAWMRHDIALTPGCDGDFAKAARRAEMPILFLPCRTDLYFDAEDVRDQAAFFPDAAVEVLDSLSGHAAGFAREPEDAAAVNREVAAFLSRI